MMESLRARIPTRAAFGVLLAFLILYPWLYHHVLPQDTQWIPDTSTAFVIVAFTVMGVGLNVVVGYAGLLDLGYVAFFAAGAYVAGWFASQQFGGGLHSPRSWIFGGTVPSGTLGIHLTPWLVIVLAAVFAALLGVLIGLPTLRLRGDYLAIVTLGFGEIIPQFVRNGDHIGGFNLTNGSFGLTGIDGLGFGTGVHSALPFLPSNFVEQVDSTWYYWTALALLGIAIATSLLLRDSRLGRAWVAIREDEDAAAAMGIPLMRLKTLAYLIGAFFGGAAGCLITLQAGATSPNAFNLQVSIFVLCMVILGGMGNVWGVLLGAAFLEYLNVEGLANIGAWLNENLGTNIDVPGYQIGIYGVLIVVVMLLRPQGLLPSARRKRELELGTHDEPAYDLGHSVPIQAETG